MNTCNFNGLTGRIVTADDPCYHILRQVYNRGVQKFPLAIVYCQNQEDVSNAVLWSRKNQVCLRIRNGGHNYEGYSTGNDVLDIDLSEMNQLDIDEEAHLLHIQGGVTNQQLYEFVSSKGYPFPGGTCPTAGVGGYALGGGFGLSCRYMGLGCDNLLEIRMVNYEGRIITANSQENADLFWACRGGGGGNFGAAVFMTFRLPQKVKKVTFIDIKYPHADREKQSLFLLTWQDWLKNADQRVTLISRIYNDLEEGLAIIAKGIFYGPPESALGIIAPLLMLGGVKYSLKYMTFLEAVTITGDFYPSFGTFQSASRFAVGNFSRCESYCIAGLIKERAEGSVYAGISLYALGGKVAEVESDKTAFYYRNADFIILLNTVYKGHRCKNTAWIAEKFSYLETVTKGSYVNFPYTHLPCCLEEYYGTHVSRLKKVKANYDPLNIFTFPQGIPSGCCAPSR